MANKDIDLQKIEKLIEIMKRSGLIEVEIKHGDDKILLKRSQPCRPQAAPSVTVVPPMVPNVSAVPADSNAIESSASETQSAASEPRPEEDLAEIKSPIVGIFYVAPSPDSDPFVEVGSHVSPQTVVGIIEAMKVMNEIKADTSGTVAEILATNGQAVEYGQVLFKVRLD